MQQRYSAPDVTAVTSALAASLSGFTPVNAEGAALNATSELGGHMRVSVDRTLCALSENCVRMAPSIFGIGPDGEVGAIGADGRVVHDEVEVPAARSDFVEEVAFGCPMTAIALSDV